MGGCFSLFQTFEAPAGGEREPPSGYAAELLVLGGAFVAEGGSLIRALHQVHGAPDGARDPALRTVIAEDSTVVFGVLS